MADTQHRPAEDLAAKGSWMDDGPDVCDGEEIDDVVHARFANDATKDNEFPSWGYASRATPIRPCPASAAADRLVKALISFGTSWPS
jgi:hypothetical protein